MDPKIAKKDAHERMQDRWLWPHLENLERIIAERPEWLDPEAEWIITEKLHGFNARFGIDADGTPWVGTRNNVVFEGPGELVVSGDPASWPEHDPNWPGDAQQGFVGFAADHVKWLKDGETLFGEWAGKGIQKGIDYGPRDFYAFGLMCDLGHLVSWDELDNACAVAGIKTVPVVYRGTLPSMTKLAEWRDANSLIATTQREGICLSTNPPSKDGWGHYLIGKYKSAAFSEVSHAKREVPPEEQPDMTALLDFIAKYATPVRFEHVLDQVRETRPNPLFVEATGDVLRAMYNDVVREAGAEYEALSDADKKMLGKVLNGATKKLLDEARQVIVDEGVFQ